MDAEERVHEVMGQVISGEADVGIEEQQVDIDERASVVAMTETTCGCKKGIGCRPCSSQFSTDQIMSVRASCSELTRSELDMVVMGQLMAGYYQCLSYTTMRAAYTFHHRGKQVGEKMFRFLHNIGETRYKNLKKSLRSNGLATHTHGNLKHSPAHALSPPIPSL